MTSAAPDNILAIAERLGFPIPEPYRAGVAEAFARLLEQAALVMSATIYYLLASMGVVGIGPSALIGLTIGVGLIGVSLLVNYSFQQRHYTLTVIDGAHWALALTIEAVVIALLA